MSGELNVSRETSDRWKAYFALLAKWNPKINLVSPATVGGAWTRHIVDSAQVFELAEIRQGLWLDMGSGGGFPGMVCAIIAAEKSPDLRFQLVDSDQRKCAFLKTVIREVGVSAAVTSERLEIMQPAEADIISARALAPLRNLLFYMHRHSKPGGIGLFQKGRNWKAEIQEAMVEWRFHHKAMTSTTDPEAAILRISEQQNV